MNNTVFRLPANPDEHFKLKPPTGPGLDSRGKDAGSIVKRHVAQGWSLADVQVRH
jgi:hypothetical protein